MIVVLIAQRNWSNKGKREKRMTFSFNPINFGLYFFDLKKNCSIFSIISNIKRNQKNKIKNSIGVTFIIPYSFMVKKKKKKKLFNLMVNWSYYLRDVIRLKSCHLRWKNIITNKFWFSFFQYPNFIHLKNI